METVPDSQRPLYAISDDDRSLLRSLALHRMQGLQRPLEDSRLESLKLRLESEPDYDIVLREREDVSWWHFDEGPSIRRLARQLNDAYMLSTRRRASDQQRHETWLRARYKKKGRDIHRH